MKRECSDFGRRGTDQQTAEDHDTFMRTSAYINLFVGALLPVVTVVGGAAIWVAHVYRALYGLPAVHLPDPPWPIWAAALWGVVFSVVGYAFYNNQIENPGRIIDLVLSMIPRRNGNGNKRGNGDK